MATIHDYVRTAFTEGATDLILSEGQSPRVRINGEVLPFENHPLDHDEMASFWKEVGADPALDLEKDIGWSSTDGSRLRVNLFNYVILRWDYAIPQDSPGRHGFWHFSLYPTF